MEPGSCLPPKSGPLVTPPWTQESKGAGEAGEERGSRLSHLSPIPDGTGCARGGAAAKAWGAVRARLASPHFGLVWGSSSSVLPEDDSSRPIPIGSVFLR